LSNSAYSPSTPEAITSEIIIRGSAATVLNFWAASGARN